MKIRNSNLTLWLAALVCLVLTPAIKAQDQTDTAEATATEDASSSAESSDENMHHHDAMAEESHEIAPETSPSEGSPTRANKASGILGMKVLNQNKQYLGRIKDLVIDWKTEQVSYAVLSTGGMSPFGQGGKMLAVPLTALAVSADQKHLILNAEKATVAAAKGFEQDNWPSVGNPSWGAQPFWQEEPGAPQKPAKPVKESESEEERTPIPDLGMR